jgi:hypothetical protein
VTRTILASTFALLLPLAVGCTVDSSSEGPSAGGPDAGGVIASCTPDNVVTTVIAKKCTGGACHDNDAPAAQLNLLSEGIADRLMNRASSGCADHVLVVAGDPSQSYLMQKLGSAPACGAQMPMGGPPLSAEEQSCISGWIADLDSSTGGTGGTGGTGTGGTGDDGGGGGGGAGW